MIKWEYRTMIELVGEKVDPSDTNFMMWTGIEEEWLNTLGDDGWELAGMSRVGNTPSVKDALYPMCLVFKRPIEE